MGGGYFLWYFIVIEIFFYIYEGWLLKVWIIKEMFNYGEREKKKNMIDIFLVCIINCDLNFGLIKLVGLMLKVYLDYIVLW